MPHRRRSAGELRPCVAALASAHAAWVIVLRLTLLPWLAMRWSHTLRAASSVALDPSET